MVKEDEENILDLLNLENDELKGMFSPQGILSNNMNHVYKKPPRPFLNNINNNNYNISMRENSINKKININ